MSENFQNGEATIRRVRGGWIVYGFDGIDSNPSGETVYTSFQKAIAAVKSFVAPLEKESENA